MERERRENTTLFCYLSAGIVSIIGNLYLVAEAPLKLHNYAVTCVFIIAKVYLCLSKKNCHYAAVISFLSSIYLICIYVLNDVPENWFCITLYFLTVLPCAPIALSLTDLWHQIILVVLIIQLLFLVISMLTCWIELVWKSSSEQRDT